MSFPKGAHQNESSTDDSKSSISSLLDTAVAEAQKEQQFESFYQKTAEALKAADENCVPLITRRILRLATKRRKFSCRF